MIEVPRRLRKDGFLINYDSSLLNYDSTEGESSGSITGSVTYSQATGLSRNVHIPYINIQFGSVSLTWRGDESRPDYFTSLTHERIKEKASKMTINITYSPKYGEDPNRIEVAILNSAGVCLVQYGDLASGIVRPYKCMITDYTVNVDHGVLSYSLTLVSAAVSYNLLPYKANPERLVGEEATIENFVKILKKAAKLMRGYYIFEDPTAVLSSAKKPESIDFGSEFKSPIKFMIDAVNQLSCQDESCLFAIDIDDSAVLGDKGRIKVVKIDTSKVQISKSFNWGTRDGTVLSWSPGFKGAQGLAASRVLDSNSPPDIVSSVDVRTGRMITAVKNNSGSVDFKSADSTVFVNNLISSTTDFLEKADYEYTGELTVLGEASPIALGETVISINPLIMGKSHHSAGDYVVIGVTDEVSGDSGFTTTYKVMRKSKSSSRQNSHGIYNGDSSYKRNNALWINGSFIPYSEYNPENLEG